MFNIKCVTRAHKVTVSKDCGIIKENKEVRVEIKLIIEDKKKI